ncbi:MULTISPECIES: hypothetical protein [unclassified Rhizobium]|uniref:hypothetical protein n=1 Tax=unclassified Rhizobium TaxID=2613769 RepID=UPI002169C357|nr:MULTISPECIES: hypothetical protein [unclassified Rhizobium]MCS3742049.1 hypothetical protein [Rhizobium sp. BK661]MCS4093960.1 hypothetical protein [Rhizobium sp. BK176]
MDHHERGAAVGIVAHVDPTSVAFDMFLGEPGVVVRVGVCSLLCCIHWRRQSWSRKSCKRGHEKVAPGRERPSVSGIFLSSQHGGSAGKRLAHVRLTSSGMSLFLVLSIFCLPSFVYRAIGTALYSNLLFQKQS